MTVRLISVPAAVLAEEVVLRHLRISEDQACPQDCEDVMRMLSAAQAYVSKTCRMAVGAATYRLTLPALTGAIELPMPPVTAITEVRYRDPDGAAQIMDSADYYIDATTDMPTLKAVTSWPSTDSRPVEIDFEAGDATVDPDVEAYLLLHVGTQYESRQGAMEKPPQLSEWAEHLLDKHIRRLVLE